MSTFKPKKKPEGEDQTSSVSVDKMQKVVDYLTDYYNLSDRGFSLTGYADKGSKISATFENDNGSATFTVTNPDLIVQFSVQ